MKLFAGLDIGTEGARIDVVNEKLEIKYESSIKYRTESPHQGWAEQNPDQIYLAVHNLLEEIAEKYDQEDLYITFCSVMHSIMGIDKMGKRLTPLIIWADTRGKKYRDKLGSDYDPDLFYRNTACPLHSTYWPAKIMWLQENVEGRIEKFVSIKEYIIYRLCGEWKTDYALASTSGILNPALKEYDPEILNLLGLTDKHFSPAYSSFQMFTFEINGKTLTGLLGSTDGALANLGAGSIDERRIVLTAGSSSAVRYTSREFTPDPEGRAWNYLIDENRYIIGEATNGAGVVLNWFKEVFDYDSIKDFDQENISRIPYQGNELIFIPTMMGERGPSYNEKTRGFLYGLSLNHNRQDMLLAVYESITLHLKMIFEDVRRLNKNDEIELIMTGGLGLTDRFMKLLYYLIGEIKYLPGYKQNTAVGAAMLGIKAVDGISYQEQLKHFPEYKTVKYEDDSDFISYLDEKYEHFCEVYQHLQENYQKINF